MLTKLEIYAIVLVLLAAVGTALYFRGHHVGYTEAKDEYAAAALKQAQESQAKEQAQRDQLLQASTNYEQQIAQIKVDAASKPPSVVRVCNRTAEATVSSTAKIAFGLGGSDPAGLGGANGSDHPESTDIGPDLDAYKIAVQNMALQCSKIQQNWPK